MMASEMASNTFPWLTLAIFVPIVFGLLVLAVGRDDRPGLTRGLSLIGSIAGFLVTIPLYTGFDSKTAAMQFVEKTSWIEAFNVNYHLGVDGISLWFVLLTAFITIIVVLAGWEVITSRVSQYMAAFLILSGLMVGVFCALDGMLFYVFFEATLIPMYIIIGVWGGPNRVYAAFKFFLYTLMGSLLTLVAFVYLWNASGGSFDILTWQQTKLGYTPQILIFVALLAAFAVKVPMWPVHTWLPDAHVEAPTGGSIVLAAIMLKLGAYGFLRFSLPIAPDASHSLAGLMITLSLIAVIYIGLVAIVQDDMKKLVAYSSVAHMGFVTLGFFIFNTAGVEGAIVQMISHGFVSGAMFMCIGVLYDRMHSRRIADYGGVVNVMPRFATFFILFSMANSGLPATSGFVGEFMVIMGAVEHNFWIGLLAATALILGASYSLWMVKRVVLGDVANDHVRELTDINRREFVILGVMAIAVLYMGIYPKPFTDVMHVSVEALLQHVAVSKL
ncbi:NADH-quinone oxidoreductase subunit M [Achromobacter xylosoxidans]|jgi:NADH-quinone oxidoreductase subunit M|uniref:NADH-quinone oxidoreductase subunit M n=3 Tax=Achromobacter TaxID=222 RepID=A0A0D6GHD4_ALCXX|nr:MULTISPECIES: NADH-quinone oxidoreductase subunit M [Achromobacter]AMH06251.1 NADH-quinone oxidoreductase subunit M [Achromobacter xylosoxidans]AXA76141.1 NADH-quinone oxidoreductase subunit M [Achromobacter xylosoxidans]KOQ27538.1 NADH:ubiquinone oxidoreductase subunit M [Achromobacter xylosoxidans]KOQ30275.1 NADH:ubiquinone oxidoreductase subunit M [Achromobacter xylosoxidans]KOQ33400.1 NADH:ubiquinone oxidoreductase subunit M [Achromobacter xylosoxidans]